MEKGLYILESIYIDKNPLFSTIDNKNLYNFCKDNKIYTFNDLLVFNVENNKDTNLKLEINGLKDLIKFKYFGLVNIKLISILNYTYIEKKLTKNEFMTYIDKTLKIFRSLGFSYKEAYILMKCAEQNNNLPIKDIINEILKPENINLYLDIENEFKNKCLLLYEYYNFYKKTINYDKKKCLILKEKYNYFKY